MNDSFFRRESARLVSALTRLFGVRHLTLAEDVAQDACARAHVLWREQGEPENPAGWLMTTAKRLALDVLRRERTAEKFAPELGRLLDTEWTLGPLVDEAFDAVVVRDEQLRMMFSCCQPGLTEDVQIACTLNICCGFSARQLSSAFLIGDSAMEKRISRGKRVLSRSDRLFQLDDEAFSARLTTVQRALYLMFNEGYHGASESPVRSELCGEALHLCALLLTHPAAATPRTAALGALFCLHAARLPTRLDEAGGLSAWIDQDRARWDRGLIDQGLALLEQSASGDELSTYHVEAAIAATHARAARLADTDWPMIVALYERLLALAPSPMVELGRAIAIGERDGADAGLRALSLVSEPERLGRYPFLPAAKAELERRRGRLAAARGHYAEALTVARSTAEKTFLARRLASLAD